jgi:hypothetical protein
MLQFPWKTSNRPENGAKSGTGHTALRRRSNFLRLADTCGLDPIKPLKVFSQQFVRGRLSGLLIPGGLLPIDPGTKIIDIIAE